MYAKDVMNTEFHYLNPRQSIAQAIHLFKEAGETEGRRIFGMMVIDNSRLVGMLSMYDILIYIQPKHIGILGEIEDISPDPLYKNMLSRVKKIRVEDLMSTILTSAEPDTHILVVMDIMIKNHVRRLPVVDKNQVVGIVYRSDLFNYLMGEILKDENE